eukprot:SAG22_NODE_1229_length_5081_cov_2.651947_2_plen_336_part_00
MVRIWNWAPPALAAEAAAAEAAALNAAGGRKAAERAAAVRVPRHGWLVAEELIGATDWVEAVALSPAGDMCVGGGRSGAVDLWANRSSAGWSSVRCPGLLSWTPAPPVSCLLTGVPAWRPGERRRRTSSRPTAAARPVRCPGQTATLDTSPPQTATLDTSPPCISLPNWCPGFVFCVPGIICEVTTCCFDGTAGPADWCATGSTDETVKVWDIQSMGSATPAVAVMGRGGDELDGGGGGGGGHTERVNCLAASPMAPLLASGGADRTVFAWDARTGTAPISSVLLDDEVLALAFAPAGAWSRTATRDLCPFACHLKASLFASWTTQGWLRPAPGC